VFADARNVLNFRNTLGLFAETGTTVNAKHRHDLLAPEYAALYAEASAAGALAGTPDNSGMLASTTQDIDLTLCCSNWGKPINCASLRRVEARFGNGDGIYTTQEQQRALNAYYDAFFGPWRFYDVGRTVRVGGQLRID
jgi:hypothetical protein